MTSDELKQEIAAVIENTIKTTMQNTMAHGAWLLSNKYGLSNEQVKEWMQDVMNLTIAEFENKGLIK